MSQPPRFPGELSDYLPHEEPREDLSDRLRHSWPHYLFLAIAVPLWIGAMVASVMFLGTMGWFIAALIILLPVGVYIRIVQWRLLTGRDPDTGERWGRQDR